MGTHNMSTGFRRKGIWVRKMGPGLRN